MPTAMLDSPRTERSTTADQVEVAGYQLLAVLIDTTPEVLRQSLGNPQGPEDWPQDMPAPLRWEDGQPVFDRMTWLRAAQDRGLLRPVEQRLADKTTRVVGYDAVGMILGGRAGQSMRKLMMRRRRHEAAGGAWPDDIPEPQAWIGPAHKAQPAYPLGQLLRFGMQSGRLATDGLTKQEIKPAGRRGNRRT